METPNAVRRAHRGGTRNSVTRSIPARRRDDQAASQGLWQVYFHRLVALAHARLLDSPRRVAGEEDVALSGFARFCRSARTGHISRRDDRNDLWQILVMTTVRKAIDLHDDEGPQSRGMGRVQSLIDLTKEALEAIGGEEPAAELSAQLTREHQRLMEQLGDSALRRVATLKLEGYTNDQIAARLYCATCAVERKLALIRRMWASTMAH
jgi:hypothetical protein